MTSAPASSTAGPRAAGLGIGHGGVWTLSRGQAAALGAPDADRIAFLKLSRGEGRLPHAFTPRELLSGMWWGRRAVVAVLNGTDDEMGYSGAAFAGPRVHPLRRRRNRAQRGRGAVSQRLGARGLQRHRLVQRGAVARALRRPDAAPRRRARAARRRRPPAGPPAPDRPPCRRVRRPLARHPPRLTRRRGAAAPAAALPAAGRLCRPGRSPMRGPAGSGRARAC